MIRYQWIGFLVAICLTSVSLAQEKIQYRIEQLLGSLEDRQLAGQLGQYRQQMFTGIESWCMEQAECEPERLSIHDLSAFVTVMNKNDPEMLLKILFDRVLKRFRDTQGSKETFSICCYKLIMVLMDQACRL